jgi:hypothetical protein
VGVLIVSNGCTFHCQVYELLYGWWDYYCFFLFELMWEYFLWPLLVHVITACTSCSIYVYFLRPLLVLPLGWRYHFVISTFGFCWYSCTSYIKWVYWLCRMVVHLIVKYLNFLTDGGIILFFLRLDFVGFHVLLIISGCTARVE